MVEKVVKTRLKLVSCSSLPSSIALAALLLTSRAFNCYLPDKSLSLKMRFLAYYITLVSQVFWAYILLEESCQL